MAALVCESISELNVSISFTNWSQLFHDMLRYIASNSRDPRLQSPGDKCGFHKIIQLITCAVSNLCQNCFLYFSQVSQFGALTILPTVNFYSYNNVVVILILLLKQSLLTLYSFSLMRGTGITYMCAQLFKVLS
jgi:hypothetical protein